MRHLLTRIWRWLREGAAPPSLLNDLASEPELERRREAWALLSDLWLDTEINTDSLARALAQLPYSVEQLDEMCIFEVGPHLFANLECVAGEWAGFDPDWLGRQITKAVSIPQWRHSAWKHRERTMRIAGGVWEEARNKIEGFRGRP